MTGVTEHHLLSTLREHEQRLREAEVPTPAVDLRLLVAHVLGEAALRPGGPPVEPAALDRLDRLVRRRAQRVPLQHLIGQVWFRHVRLGCRPGVFIPRPETEVVAGIAIDAAGTRQNPIVLEPCTGSGAISAALVSEVAGVRVHATDSSAEAVALARTNLQRVAGGEGGGRGAAPGATWQVAEGDLFDPLDPALRHQVDVIVANPPYMPARDRAGWEPEVAMHDPVLATVGGEDGHELVWRILDEARAWLRYGGTIVVEIDERRGDETARRARRLGYTDVAVRRDLTGADRALVGTWLSDEEDRT